MSACMLSVCLPVRDEASPLLEVQKVLTTAHITYFCANLNLDALELFMGRLRLFLIKPPFAPTCGVLRTSICLKCVYGGAYQRYRDDRV
jgi:hypothetical protein